MHVDAPRHETEQQQGIIYNKALQRIHNIYSEGDGLGYFAVFYFCSLCFGRFLSYVSVIYVQFSPPTLLKKRSKY